MDDGELSRTLTYTKFRPENLEGKTPLEKLKHRWNDYVKISEKEERGCGLGSSGSGCRAQWQAFMNVVSSIRQEVS